MPSFTYNGTDQRVYPQFRVAGPDGALVGLVAEPGETYDLTDAPADGRWAGSESVVAPPAPDQPQAPQTAPEATP